MRLRSAGLSAVRGNQLSFVVQGPFYTELRFLNHFRVMTGSNLSTVCTVSCIIVTCLLLLLFLFCTFQLTFDVNMGLYFCYRKHFCRDLFLLFFFFSLIIKHVS